MDRNSKLYSFGPFSLDPHERVLFRDGQLVPLPAKAFKTLLVLVRNNGHVVEKDQLMKEVWPDEFVEEGNLAQHIFLLRKTLSQTTDSRKYIETIPRRGYRFLEPVKESHGETGPSQQHQPISKRHTENSAAYQAYVKGRYYWSTYTTSGLEEAIKWFRQTINLDPGFALAYAAIIDCYLRLATNYLPPENDLPRTMTSRDSLELDEKFPEAQEFLKVRREWDAKAAERECKRALDLKSNYPAAHQWYAAYVFARRLYERHAKPHVATVDEFQNQASGLVHDHLLDNIQSSRPTPAEEVQVFCIIAREQIEAGNYEAACAMLERWWKVGDWPNLTGLSPYSSADLLFTVGSLACNVVSTRQVPKGQKHAEALLNGSIALFEQLGAKPRSAEGRIELALCYQREGLFDLSRATLLAALDELGDDLDLKGLCLMRIGSLEHAAGHLHAALEWLNKSSEIVESLGPWISGRHRLSFGSTLKNLAVVENVDYFPLVLEHYTKALFEFDAVGHHRLAGIVENNYGLVLMILDRLDEAEPHLVRARNLFNAFGDKVRCAQVDETLAQFYLAREQFEVAEKIIQRSVDMLELGGEDAILAESLRTQGVVLCKLNRYREAQSILERAQQVAEHCGDTEGAERARLIRSEVVDQLTDELKSSQERLLVLERKAAEQRLTDSMTQEMFTVLSGVKTLLDQALGANGSECHSTLNLTGRQALAEVLQELKAPIGDGQLEAVYSRMRNVFAEAWQREILEQVRQATHRGLDITQQMMLLSKSKP